MDTQELKAIARKVYESVESDGPDAAVATREWLGGKGFEPGAHVGTAKEDFEADENMKLEWAIGQFMSLVDKKAWFAMNSVLNTIFEMTDDD